MRMNEIRKLTMTDISCNLLLHGSVELDTSISKNVFNAVHRFIDETGRLELVIFTSEPYCLHRDNLGIVNYPILDCVVNVCACVVR